jgi:hypothetical protein
LIASSLQLSDSVVSQGETDQTLSLRVNNTGEAPARIFSLDSIQFNYNSTYSLSLTSGQNFPYTINGGDSALFIYDVSVAAAAAAGADTFRAVIGYEDVNSGVDYQANNPAIYDDWQVLSDVSLNIVSVTAAATRVTQGQDSLLVLLEVGNTGGVDAVIGSTDSLGIQFLANNNTVTLIGPTLPDTIGASFSEVYSFYVTVNTSAATGIDSLRGFAIGRNVRTGQTNNVTSSYLDGWDVQTPANIAITSVFNGFSQVNSGQQDLSVEIRLFNQGQATALLDSSDMFGIPGGFITDSLQLATFPDSIISGGRDTVLFNVDVSAAYTGQLELDASIDYRDGNDTTRALAASGAVNRHTWTVGSDGILVVDSVFSDVTTMSLGQSGVPVRAQISNVGSAAVQIDSLRMLFNGSDTHTVLSATRVQPATLPLLSTGQSFIAEFSLSAASLPLDSGVVVFDLAAFGTDQITLALIDTMSRNQCGNS